MSKDNDIKAKIEAALYVAGRPLNTDELAKAAGISSLKNVVKATRMVLKSVNTYMAAIEIVEFPGTRFAMQLKPKHNLVARKFALKPLMPKSVLRTLSHIVYFQPITSAEMALQRGSQIYQHLRLLHQMGFVDSERAGRTKIYRTTSLFSQYFGFSDKVDEMKRQLSRSGGIAKRTIPLNL